MRAKLRRGRRDSGSSECAREVISSRVQDKALAHARLQLGLDRVSCPKRSPAAGYMRAELRGARCDSGSRERARDVISSRVNATRLLHARLELGLDRVSWSD